MSLLRLWALLYLLISSAACSFAQTPAINKPSLVANPPYQYLAGGSRMIITHVTIVDTKTGIRLFNRNVEIDDGRIIAITRADSFKRKNTRVINGHGKFLIPGLWDMEVHLSWCKKSSIPLLIANGVTDVRDMGGDFGEIEVWRAKISSGELTGPHILQVGPMLNGKSFNKYQLAVTDSVEATAVVRTLKFIGVDGLEIERRLSKDSYMAVIGEARRQGIPVGGHVQLTVSPAEASNAGQRTVENIESVYYGTFAKKIDQKDLADSINDFLRSAAADTLFRLFARNHTAVTPVINTFRWSLNQFDPKAAADPNSRYVAASLKQEAAASNPSIADLAPLRAEFPALLHTIAKMYRDSVMILAGTDIAGTRVPGFSLHAELKELVNAGLPPLVALQAATINPAVVLGIDKDYGSVEVGKIANLVLLDADPLVSIGNTRKISGVIVGGKYLNREAIDLLLKTAEAQAIKE